MKPLLCIALDDLWEEEHSTLTKVEAILQKVPPDRLVLKANLDFALKRGLKDAVQLLQSFSAQLFVDLKMFNGSRTMERIAQSLVDLDVDYFNVHLLADKESRTAIKAAKTSKTRVLGVTVLSHMDEGYCQQIFKLPRKSVVRNLAQLGNRLGCDGIILPADTIPVIQHSSLLCATGIRPTWYKDTRHAVETTPTKAVEIGADILVCGGPIMNSEDPGAAATRILDEMDSVGF
ncbi:MAG: orotidine 5'-phosphate decarboxylase / HUMPS family protein [Candidatus Andersenbacteria bacterium]